MKISESLLLNYNDVSSVVNTVKPLYERCGMTQSPVNTQATDDTEADTTGQTTNMSIMITQFRTEAMLGGDPDSLENPMHLPEW